MLSCTFSTVFSVVGLTTDFCFPCHTGRNYIRGLCWAASTTKEHPNIPERMFQDSTSCYHSFLQLWFDSAGFCSWFFVEKNPLYLKQYRIKASVGPKRDISGLENFSGMPGFRDRAKCCQPYVGDITEKLGPKSRHLKYLRRNGRLGTPGLQWALSRSSFCTFRKYLNRS